LLIDIILGFVVIGLGLVVVVVVVVVPGVVWDTVDDDVIELCDGKVVLVDPLSLIVISEQP
jgi:hypothetical protein